MPPAPRLQIVWWHGTAANDTYQHKAPFLFATLCGNGRTERARRTHALYHMDRGRRYGTTNLALLYRAWL